MPKHASPFYVESLDQFRCGRLDKSREGDAGTPFRFLILLPVEGGYMAFGQYVDLIEALAGHRRLVEETGNRSYYLHAVRCRLLGDSCFFVGTQ